MQLHPSRKPLCEKLQHCLWSQVILRPKNWIVQKNLKFEEVHAFAKISDKWELEIVRLNWERTKISRRSIKASQERFTVIKNGVKP